MNKFLITFFLNLFFAVSQLVAQTDTTWFDANWNICPKKQALFYRPQPKQTDSGFIVKDFYKSGKIQYEALWENLQSEKILGTAIWYNEDGGIRGKKSGENFIKEGDLISYYTNGNIKEKTQYKNYKKNGENIRYYNNGKIALVSNWFNGELEGEAKSYHENGKIETIASYKNGLSDGLYKIYDDYNKLISSTTFSNGEYHGKYYKFAQGNDTCINIDYEKGTASGVVIKKRYGWEKYEHKNDTATYFRINKGKITGRYVNYDVQGYVIDNKIISLSKKNSLEATAINDSIAEWHFYNYNYETKNKSKSHTGFTTNNYPSGKWTFFSKKGITNEVYEFNKFSPQSTSKKNTIGVIEEDVLEEYYNIYNLEYIKTERFSKYNTEIKYIAYDSSNKIVAKGILVNNQPIGIWDFKLKNGQTKTLNFSKKIIEKDYEGFVEVFKVKSKNNIPDIILPWQIYFYSNESGVYLADAGLLFSLLIQNNEKLEDKIINSLLKKYNISKDEEKLMYLSMDIFNRIPQLFGASKSEEDYLIHFLPINLKNNYEK